MSVLAYNLSFRYCSGTCTCRRLTFTHTLPATWAVAAVGKRRVQSLARRQSSIQCAARLRQLCLQPPLRWTEAARTTRGSSDGGGTADGGGGQSPADCPAGHPGCRFSWTLAESSCGMNLRRITRQRAGRNLGHLVRPASSLGTVSTTADC